MAERGRNLTNLFKSNPVTDAYVRALYDVAAKHGVVDKVSEELNELKNILTQCKDTRKLLKRISLIKKEAEEFAVFLSKQMKLSEIVSNFLKVLVKNNRFFLLMDICEIYAQRIDQLSGKVKIFVKYADKFTLADKKLLLNNLKPVFGESIECIAEQDKSLIGGIVLQHGSKILDYSVKSKLARLRSAIRGEYHEDKAFGN